MAWTCYDFCNQCGVEHQIYIREEKEPEWKSVFEYDTPCSASGVKRFRYSLYSDQVPAVPEDATVARRPHLH